MSTTLFKFRIWLSPDDPTELEVWYDELENTNDGNSRFVSDWIYESFMNEDHCELFSLDEGENWQVMGNAEIISNHSDWYEDYDEYINILDFKYEKVSDSFYEDSYDILKTLNDPI